MSVVWHDLECGAYTADVPLWRSLADARPGPVLDVGAGTGRIALDLARQGRSVTALDRDPTLIAELATRADGLEIETVLADAREFELGKQFALVIVPMQTIQLLGGVSGRARFLECARRHLGEPGLLAIAISERLELYEAEAGYGVPLPDIRELGGVVYSSQPTAVREQQDGFLLERRRETVNGEGERIVEQDLVQLDRLTADGLEQEARDAGLHPDGRLVISPTADHVGSVVVMLRG